MESSYKGLLLEEVIFLESLKTAFNNNNKFDIITYNQALESIVCFFEHPHYRGVFGDRYQLDKVDDILLCRDSFSGKYKNFFKIDVEHFFSENIEFVAQFRQLKESIYEKMKDIKKQEAINVSANSNNIYEMLINDIQSPCFILKPENNLKEILKTKVFNTMPTEVVYSKKLGDHLNSIKNSLDLDFFKHPKFDSSSDNMIRLIQETMNMNHLIPDLSNNRHPSLEFILIQKDKSLIGGTYIANNIDAIEVKKFNILPKYKANYNIDEAWDKILKKLPKQRNIILSEDIQNIDKKNYRIYSDPIHVRMLNELRYFLNKNTIESSLKDEIYHKFYQDKKTLSEHEGFMFVKKFISDIRKDYKLPSVPDISSRQNFLNYLILSEDKANGLKYLNGKEDTQVKTSFYWEYKDSIYTDPIDFIHNRVVSKFSELGIKLDDKQSTKLEDHILSNLDQKKDAIHCQYHFNASYDFLIENKLIPSNTSTFVYRLETYNNQGIYDNYDSTRHHFTTQKEDAILNSHDRLDPLKDIKLSSLFNEGKNNYSSQWFFGFKDQEQLRDWFSVDELKQLAKSDHFKVSRYEIDQNNIVYSDKQVVFKKFESLGKVTMSLNSFIEVNGMALEEKVIPKAYKLKNL